MLKRPEFQPYLDHFWVLGRTVTLTKLFPTQECVGNREVSGQPDKMPKATGPASYHRRGSIKYF